MFAFIKKIFFKLLYFRRLLAAKGISLNNEECTARKSLNVWILVVRINH